MNMKLVAIILIVLAGFVIVAVADDPTDGDNIFTNPKSGLRPGQNDPMKPTFNTLFKDDEALLMVGNPAAHQVEYTYFSPNKKDLTSWTKDGSNTHQFESSEYVFVDSDYEKSIWASARGRIDYSDHDSTAYAFYQPGGHVEVELWTSYERESGWVDISGKTGTAPGFIDVAVGDVDMMIQDKTYYWDEIVVLRACGSPDGISYTPCLDVIDYNWDSMIGDFDLTNVKNKKVRNAAVGIGDLDGDGFMEIVTAQVEEWEILQVDVLRLKRQDNGEVETPPTLEEVATYSTTTVGEAESVMDMTVGDFDGDGQDDVALVHGYYLTIYSADVDPDDGTMTLKKKSQINYFGNFPTKAVLVDGLFMFIPPPESDWGIRRRELGVFFIQETAEELFYNFYKVHADFSIHLTAGGSLGQSGFESLYSIGDFSAYAGNFSGHLENNTQPNDQVAVAYVQKERESISDYTWDSTPHLAFITLATDGTDNVVAHDWAGSTSSDTDNMPILVTADDMDGDSYRLGPPVHFTIENLLYLDFIIQEPPKHVDYLPNDDGEWQIYNVSGWEDFAVELSYKTTSEMETKTTTQTSESFGASVSASAEESIGGDVGDIFSAEISDEIKTKASYDYENTATHIDTTWSEESLEYTCSTAEDDFIKGKVQLMDIWRYPIYGVKDDTDKHGFQEIIIPGPVYKFEGAGRTHADWYQPVHQNRNLFSYPHLADAKFPHDLGSFAPADSSGDFQGLVTMVMNNIIQKSYGGVEDEWDFEWSSGAGSENEKEYKHSINASTEITIGTKASAEIGPFEAEEKTSVSFGLDAGVSFSNSTLQSTKNSTSSGIKIKLPDHPNAEISYDLITAGYVSDSGGTFKVAHAVQLGVNTMGKTWWENHYGEIPDPALNLPNMFTYTQNTQDPNAAWILNEDEDARWEMRGFFLRQQAENKVTKLHDIIPGAIVDGDTVLACARVYNYSLYQATGDFSVVFEYLPYDNKGGHTADTAPTKIGTATVSSLDGKENLKDVSYTEACVSWDTTGLSALVVDDVTYDHYQFFVTLDPDDDVKNEVHELYDGNKEVLEHSNNVGHWPWGAGVMVISATSTKTLDLVYPVSKSMEEESLAVLKDGEFITDDSDYFFVGTVYKLRAHFNATGASSHNQHVYFFDGNPKDGGVMIGSRILYGAKEGDNYAWAYWKPKTVGEHTLYAQVIEESGDEKIGDAWDKLTVMVLPESGGNLGGDLCGCGCSVTDGAKPSKGEGLWLLVLGLIIFAVRRKRA